MSRSLSPLHRPPVRPLARLPNLKLVIAAINGTIVDELKQWAKMSHALLTSTSRAANRDLSALIAEILAELRAHGPRAGAAPQSRLARALEHLPKILAQLASVRSIHDPKARAEFDAACHEWFRGRDAKIHPYDGVIETLHAIRTAGIAFVLHTDMSGLAALGRLRAAGIPPALVDRVYVQPGDIFKSKADLAPFADTYVMEIADKVVALPAGSLKANEEFDNTRQILNDFGITPEEALMVGATLDDAMTAARAGVPFAWQQQGAELDPEAVSFTQSLGFLVAAGIEDVGKQLMDFATNRPDFAASARTLEGGFSDLMQLLPRPRLTSKDELEERPTAPKPSALML